jgi:hypothetical protein
LLFIGGLSIFDCCQQIAIFIILNKFHFYYFCYFNHWYKDGVPQFNLLSLSPMQRPLAILVVFPWILLCDIRLIITWFFHLKPNVLFNGYAELGLLLFFWWAYYQYFISTERFRAIYVQYKLTDYRIQDRVFSVIATILILVWIMSVTAFALFFFSLSKANSTII